MLQPGCKAKLLYNNKAGPLSHIEPVEGGAPALKLGHNSWQDIQVCLAFQPRDAAK